MNILKFYLKSEHSGMVLATRAQDAQQPTSYLSAACAGGVQPCGAGMRSSRLIFTAKAPSLPCMNMRRSRDWACTFT